MVKRSGATRVGRCSWLNISFAAGLITLSIIFRASPSFVSNAASSPIPAVEHGRRSRTGDTQLPVDRRPAFRSWS